jgi:cytochrome c-type biogenesis protein CcmE
LKFIIAGGMVGLAVAYLVLVGVQGTTVYFLTVSELQAKGPTAQNQLVRVSGNLVPGSLGRDASGLGISFSIADTAATTPLNVTSGHSSGGTFSMASTVRTASNSW